MAKAVKKQEGPLEQSYATVLPIRELDLAAKKFRKKLVLDAELVVYPDDPLKELRRLTQTHKNWTIDAQRWKASVSDKKDKKTGKKVKCNKDPSTIADGLAVAEKMKRQAKHLEKAMKVQLLKFPVFTLFLDKVYGCGVVAAAYLIAYINIERAVKPSMLRRYCGNAPDDTGRLERYMGASKYKPNGEFDPTRKGSFNQELRTRLYQMFTAMRKAGVKAQTRCEKHSKLKPNKTASPAEKEAFRGVCALCSDCMSTKKPYGSTSKYLDHWAAGKFSQRTCPAPAKGTPPHVARPEDKGRMKATDSFLEDLYMVMRSLAGLEVWPTYATIKRGFAHGDIPAHFSPLPVKLSIQEALTLVGDVGDRPATSFLFDAGAEDEEEDTAESE